LTLTPVRRGDALDAGVAVVCALPAAAVGALLSLLSSVAMTLAMVMARANCDEAYERPADAFLSGSITDCVASRPLNHQPCGPQAILGGH
jgi:hypothetical protein